MPYKSKEKKRQVEKARRERAKANGLCVRCCKRPAHMGRSQCEECRQRAVVYNKWYEQEHTENKRANTRAWFRRNKDWYNAYAYAKRKANKVWVCVVEGYNKKQLDGRSEPVNGMYA